MTRTLRERWVHSNGFTFSRFALRLLDLLGGHVKQEERFVNRRCPIAAYTASDIDGELDTSTRSFLQQSSTYDWNANEV